MVLHGYERVHVVSLTISAKSIDAAAIYQLSESSTAEIELMVIKIYYVINITQIR